MRPPEKRAHVIFCLKHYERGHGTYQFLSLPRANLKEHDEGAPWLLGGRLLERCRGFGASDGAKCAGSTQSRRPLPFNDRWLCVWAAHRWVAALARASSVSAL